MKVRGAGLAASNRKMAILENKYTYIYLIYTQDSNRTNHIMQTFSCISTCLQQQKLSHFAV